MKELTRCSRTAGYLEKIFRALNTKYFDGELASADGSLKLNIGPMTNVMTLNGQQYTCSPENTELLVYYTASTFSIPAQTTPQKVIVMCQY